MTVRQLAPQFHDPAGTLERPGLLPLIAIAGSTQSRAPDGVRSVSVFWNRFIAASCLTGLVLGTGIAVLLRRAGGPWWLTALIQLGVCVPVGYYWGKVANRAR